MTRRRYHIAKGQSHSLNFVQGQKDSAGQVFPTSSLKPLRRLKPNFMLSVSGLGKRTFVQGVKLT